ncbi:helix-turn-helix domain-containing protein [Actinocrispum wychmicini]|uniref:helix-turn-helix domain-containing protein n=1 Tax=Actinocrispum wychmicini TaxID=1213861 RepID=UPI0014049F19|nr:helix-turn-helix transcriptional regulator [Actinocrispum wychmicini]
MSNDAPTQENEFQAVARLAGEIRRLRKAAGLSQSKLAADLGYTRQYVSRAERSGRPLPSADLVKALDLALAAGGELLRLREQAQLEQRARRHATGADVEVGQVDHGEEIHAGIQRLRRVLDARDLYQGGFTRPAHVLDQAVVQLTEARLQARYVQIARTAPELIAEILQAQAEGQQNLSRALTLAYRAADGLAFKYGYTDLSARLIELMRGTAEESGDELLIGTVSYVRTETFFATDDLETARCSLTQALDRIPTKALVTAPGSAVNGSLHMRAAVVAARLGESDSARDHLVDAKSMADQAPEGVYYGTAFGPDSVRIHEVAVHIDLGDAPTALERTGVWQPPQQLPAERRSHYFIDRARAQAQVGLYGDAYDGLRTARQIAPQQVRHHPHVRQSLAALMRTRLGRDADVRNFAGWAGLSVR